MLISGATKSFAHLETNKQINKLDFNQYLESVSSKQLLM